MRILTKTFSTIRRNRNNTTIMSRVCLASQKTTLPQRTSNSFSSSSSSSSSSSRRKPKERFFAESRNTNTKNKQNPHKQKRRGRGGCVFSASSSSSNNTNEEGEATSSSSSSTSFDETILVVARKAALEISTGMTIAVGTGSICSKLLDVLETEKVFDVKYVPVSTLAAKELALRGLAPVVDCEEALAIDVVFLQPNETAIYDGNIVSILDRTQTPIQPSIATTRNVLKKSLKTILLTEQFREYVGGSVPVEIEMENWEETAEDLDDLFLGDAELWRRGQSGDEQSHPMGGKNPFVSPDGTTTIIDIKFEDAIKGGRYTKGFVLAGEDCTPFQIQAEIESVDGVVAHGLFTTADAVLAPWGDGGLTPLFLHKGEELPID